eukprot:CAMPEP_0184296346 /NCGR_PEP_ID=MMETSP1049-20130417/7336_1 /TAXON_ID=77928 /ORGANISM="Proteomonas sulcata, Strain CCMP704" /LENGTH=178 /DNA_ID=CAMNT_0026605537 /DNA_START=30 /DNA_END=566 /DNA_ORIENTATION=+
MQRRMGGTALSSQGQTAHDRRISDSSRQRRSDPEESQPSGGGQTRGEIMNALNRWMPIWQAAAAAPAPPPPQAAPLAPPYRGGKAAVADTVGNLPICIISDKDAERLAKLKAECVICLNGFALGDEVKTMPCMHSFHTECLDLWLSSSALCPVCKYDLATLHPSLKTCSTDNKTPCSA